MTMRQRANWSLACLGALFIVMLVVRQFSAQAWWLDAVLFIVEAGMVGALADWFAVTALFRHPLGQRWIPHTAIVPRKKDQLIEGVVKLVEEQLLDKAFISARLNEINIVATVLDYIGHTPLKRLDDVNLKAWLIKLLLKLSSPHSIGKAENAIEQFLLQAPLAKWVGQLLIVVQKNNADDRLIQKLLDALYVQLEKPEVRVKIKELLTEATTELTETSFFKRLLFQAAQAINAVNLDDAAAIIYKDLLQLVQDMKEEQHPVRKLLAEHIRELAETLQQNEDLNAVLRVWSTNVLRELKLQTWLPAWLQPFFAFINEQDGTRTVELIARLTKKWIHASWTWFTKNQEAQQRVESYIKSFLAYLIQYEYKIVGDIVKLTLSNFSDVRLVQFIESKVETDLQRIRLNGALIGALVGALLYLFLHGLYTPLLAWL